MRSQRGGLSRIFWVVGLIVFFGLVSTENSLGNIVTTSGRQILVNGTPFTVKGVVYSPVPIGVDPETTAPFGDYFNPNHSAIYNRDLPLLREMGANAIRLMGWSNTAEHHDFLDKAYNNGIDPIYVIPTFWMGPSLYPDISSSSARAAIKADFRAMVSAHKGHPAILMWSIGNELNAPWMYGDKLNDLFSLINEMAEEAHQEEGANYHPVTTPLLDDKLINTISAYDFFTTSLDVWAANVYRGQSFGTLFDQYREISNKPLAILEFGIDAYDNRVKDEYENVGTPYQALFAESLWNEIEANSNVCIGGAIMAFSDEWWKGKYSSDPACQDNSPLIHVGCGYASSSHPDGYSNEEWWGIFRTIKNNSSVDIMEPRGVFNSLKLLWTAGEETAKAKLLENETCPSTISFGQTIQCSIDAANESDSYTFSGSANDKVLVRMSRSSGSLYPVVRLYGPDGTKLAETNSVATSVEITSAALPSTGTYTIIASGYYGTDTGNYNLTLERLNPGSGPSINLGDTKSGSLVAGDLDSYTFSGSANDKVLVRMSRSSGSLYPVVRLYGPDGTKLAETNSVATSVEITSAALPSTGTYTIIASGYYGTDTGNYNLTLERLNPGSGPSINLGDTKSGSLVAGDLDSYTFSGSANDKVLVRMSRSSGSLYPVVRLYGPDGTKLAETNSVATSVEITSAALPSTGTYTIIASGYYGTDTGNYNLTLERLNPGSGPSINLGDTKSGSLVAGDLDSYTFSGSANDKVLVRMSRSSGSLYPVVRLYGPDGTKLAETNSVATSVEITSAALPSTGTYTIIASDHYGVNTGNYSLYLGQSIVGNMEVTPVEGLDSSGYRYGPFSPSSKIYTLKNTGNELINWTITKSQAWVGLSASSGTLAGGENTNITVSISAEANNLVPGSYSDTVNFTNITNGSGNTTRGVTLTVREPGQIISLPLGTSERITAQDGQPLLFETIVPEGSENLFILLQKDSSWSGSLEIRKDGILLGNKIGSSDSAIQINASASGSYITKLSGSGAGVISAVTSLRELNLGEWNVGTILRQWGSAWYQINVPSGQSMLAVAVETIGIWSKLEVFYGTLGSTQRWTATGDRASLQINSPTAGRYYVHLTDSAWIQGSEQRRDHMIKADVNPIEPPPSTNPAITSISTIKGGTAGPVTITINGQNLDPSAIVCLKREDHIDICATSITGFDNNHTLLAIFDLASAEPGNWTLMVTNPDSQSATAPTSFTVETDGEAKLSVEIIGREQIRVGRDQKYVIKISNLDSKDALCPSIWIEHVPGIEIVEIKGNKGNILWPEDVNTQKNIPIGGQSLISNTTTSGTVDAVIIIPDIPAKSTHQMEIKLRTSTPMDLNRISVTVGTYSLAFLTGVVDLPGYLAALLNRKTEEYGGDIRNYSEFENLMLDSLADFWNDWWSNPGEKLFHKLIDELGSRMVGVARERADDLINVDPEKAQRLLDLASSYEQGAGAAKEATKQLPALALENLKNTWPKALSLLKAMGILPVTSISPEDKYGPTGYDPEGTLSENLKRYIAGDGVLTYKIDFWNKETAPAPTQDVIITDQLDANLDWNTFSFTEIGFLKWKVPLEGGQYFNVDVDLRPDNNLIVNVEGTYDPATGQIRWEFHSLDPLTGQPPEDPMAGFLPPITDTGYEIGWVTFNVNPKKNLPTGSQIRNQAWVKFDVDIFKPAPPNPDSEIPGYGPYLNTIDAGVPASSVSPLAATQNTLNFTVTWSGSDDEGGSGIKEFDIYVSDNGNPYTLWITSSETSAIFTGKTGHSYSFYSRARDNVGNIEDAPTTPDANTEILQVLAVPYGWVEVGGDHSDVALTTYLNPDGTVWYYGTSAIFEKPDTYWVGLDILLFPFSSGAKIIYNISANNHSPSPIVFNFGFGIDCNIPAGQPTTISSRSYFSLNDETGDGVSVAPTQATIQKSYVDGIDLGIGVGHASSTAGGVYIEETLGPTPGPVGPLTHLSAMVSFILTGNHDLAVFTLNSTEITAESVSIPGDFAPADCDVDGSDLAALIANPSLIDLSTFAQNFGKNVCQ